MYMPKKENGKCLNPFTVKQPPTYLPISTHDASLPHVRPPHFPANLLYPSDKLLLDPYPTSALSTNLGVFG